MHDLSELVHCEPDHLDWQLTKSGSNSLKLGKRQEAPTLVHGDTKDKDRWRIAITWYIHCLVVFCVTNSFDLFEKRAGEKPGGKFPAQNHEANYLLLHTVSPSSPLRGYNENKLLWWQRENQHPRFSFLQLALKAMLHMWYHQNVCYLFNWPPRPLSSFTFKSYSNLI